ncbi:MAG: hypothetical protein DMG52_35710 [Acidobacteria bacterium]|nr:MAG: hypothetical protein DMG52_35710 [Acidobacteriota bacterium]
MPLAQAAQRQRISAEKRPGRLRPQKPQRLRDDRYDADNNLTAKTDRKNQQITCAYDMLNPPTTEDLRWGLWYTITLS